MIFEKRNFFLTVSFLVILCLIVFWGTKREATKLEELGVKNTQHIPQAKIDSAKWRDMLIMEVFSFPLFSNEVKRDTLLTLVINNFPLQVRDVRHNQWFPEPYQVIKIVSEPDTEYDKYREEFLNLNR